MSEKKKVGILTFHRAFSYGAALQAYALQNFLFSLGIENEIIDYQCQYIVDHYQKIFRKNNSGFLRGLAWNILTASTVQKQKKVYEEFVNAHLKMSKPFDKNNISSAVNEYDFFISGSDQVWSPTCAGFDPVYFLDFARHEQKFSYAASIASKNIPENIKAEYTKRISDFSGCSVREESGAKLVRELTGKDALVHIDPTLLIDADGWDKLATETDRRSSYILLFTVLKPVKLIDYALKLSKQTGLPVVYLNNLQPQKVSGIEYIDPVTPDKFISLIKNAEYVCTNSFHGTAFSVIYHKKFAVEIETASKSNIRSQELLESLNLSDRMLLADHAPKMNDEISFEQAEKVIAAERQRSEEYLKNIGV